MVRFNCVSCKYSIDKECAPASCPYCGDKECFVEEKNADEIVGMVQ